MKSEIYRQDRLEVEVCLLLILTLIVADEAGPVAEILVTFDNLLLTVIVTFQSEA